MYVRNKQGQALVLALLVMLILFFLTISLLDIGVSRRLTTYNRADKVQAYYHADGGIERILAKITGDPQWVDNELNWGYSTRFYYDGATVTVRKQMDFDDTILRITSVGYQNQARQSLKATVKIADPLEILSWEEKYQVLPD